MKSSPPICLGLSPGTPTANAYGFPIPWPHSWICNDYNRLHAPIVGLYLTPISGDGRFFSDIVKGEYKEWSPFILRNLNTKGFPLSAVTALPIDNECIFYSDRNRWSVKAE